MVKEKFIQASTEFGIVRTSIKFFLHRPIRRIIGAPLHSLPLCFSLLGLVTNSSKPSPRHFFLSKSRELQETITRAFLHGNYNINVLDHLESTKWPHLQPTAAFFTRRLKRAFKSEFALFPVRTIKKLFFSFIDSWLNNLV